MPAPDRRPEPHEDQPLTPEERGRMARAAALRPINLIVLVIGAVFFVATTAWWIPVLAVSTYAALVFLGSRDPLLRQRMLGRGGHPPGLSKEDDVPPERRARWLPRGGTREKVEAALVEYRRVVAAIGESDEVTRTVLQDTVPRLHATADRLVDVARGRERAAGTARDLRQNTGPESGARSKNLRELETRITAADAEISETSEELLDLRAKVVRISIDTENAARAEALNASLDELNARLEALGDVTAPREDPNREP